MVAHNIETVRSLTPKVRSAAKYEVSLAVLRHIADKGFRAKSGMMLGLGESEDEIFATFDDLLANGCTVLTIGQYLQPTKRHLPVIDYITPQRFDEYKAEALRRGFAFVESGPLVRRIMPNVTWTTNAYLNSRTSSARCIMSARQSAAVPLLATIRSALQ